MKTKTKEFKPLAPQVSREHRKKKLNEAIKVLDEVVKIRVAPSPIQGVGVFAMRDLRKGEKLYTDAVPHVFDVPHKMFKKLRPEVSEYILGRWPNVVKGSHFFVPDSKMAAFLNHSDTPNYDAKIDKTLKKIKKGEEITENYRLIDGYEQVFPWLKKTML